MSRVLFIARSSKYTLGLPQGFREIGCPVHVLQDINSRSIEEAIDDFRPEVLITTGWAFRKHKRSYLEEIVQKVAKYKIQHLYWATEDPRWTKECSFRCIEILKPHAILTIDPSSVSKYLHMGIPAGHLDFGCNPEFNRSILSCKEYSYDVAVIGNGGKRWKSFRKNSVELLLKPLIERGYNIAIWGKRWEHFNENLMGFKIPEYMLKGELPYEETNKVYNSAKIIIGLQNDEEMLTSRTFEVIGSGGFLLTASTKAVNNLFKNNFHLMCSSSPEDTINITEYFLKDEVARKEIARNGQLEVYAKHTYKERALQILRFLTNV